MPPACSNPIQKNTTKKPRMKIAAMRCHSSRVRGACDARASREVKRFAPNHSSAMTIAAAASWASDESARHAGPAHDQKPITA